MIALQTSDRNGFTVAALQVMPGQEIMLISSTGTLVRTTVDEISVQGRNTQGVRLIRLGEGERLVGIERIESLEASEEGSGGRARCRRRRSAAGGGDLGRKVPIVPGGTLQHRPLLCGYSISLRGRPTLPLEVLEQVRDELTDWQGMGASVMEVSHRGKAFMAVAQEAEGAAARAARGAARLQGAVPAGRRDGPVLGGPDESRARGLHASIT